MLLDCPLWLASAFLWSLLFFPLLVWTELNRRRITNEAERFSIEINRSIRRVNEITRELRAIIREKGKQTSGMTRTLSTLIFKPLLF